MPSRRFHQKSRHGCANCRQRHIRCDEERPVCQNCTRLGGRCAFLDLELHQRPVPEARHEERSAAPSAEFQPIDIPPNVLTLPESESDLLNHYSVSTALTITDKVELLPTWQFSIPEHALVHPFLRHGLCAIAAMHIRQTSIPSTQLIYTELASRHHGNALALYIPELRSVTEQNCDGLFAFACVLPALCYCFLQSEDKNLQGEDYVARIVNIVDYLLGTKVVAHTGRMWIRQGTLLPMMTPRELCNVLSDLGDDPQRALNGLIDQIDKLYLGAKEQDANVTSQSTVQSQEESQAKVYLHSIEMLSTGFSRTDGTKPFLSVVIGWPVFLQPEFVELLRGKDPMALVILAHYGAALHQFNKYWWLRDVGARLVQAVHQSLGSEWSVFLQWPLAKTAPATDSVNLEFHV